MVWFQVNIPLVVGCLLMAALMNLRLFKLCLLVASVLLMFLGAGAIVFGTMLGTIPTYAVGVLSVMVWLCCAVSAIRRWLCSHPAYEQLGNKAETARGKAWMLDFTSGKLTGPIVSELHFDRVISEPSGSMPYPVVLEEASWEGLVPLVTLDAVGGTVSEARSFDPSVLQIPNGRLQKSPPFTNSAVRPRNNNRFPAAAGQA